MKVKLKRGGKIVWLSQELKKYFLNFHSQEKNTKVFEKVL